MDNLHASLLQMGLNNREATLYLALLGIGSAPASTLAQRTGMPKSTALYACKQLTKKGFFSLMVKDGTQLFTPEPPQKILQLLERQRKSLEKKHDRMQEMVGPLLQMMSPHVTLPSVEFFDTVDALVRMYERILDMRQPLCSFEEKGELVRFFPVYGHEYVRKRVALGTPSRTIAPEGSPLNVTDPAKLLEVRHLDPGRYPLSCDVKMCGDCVSIVSFEQTAPVGILIRNADITRHFRLMFEFMWESLPPAPPARPGAPGRPA